jgi:hypothetical protein
MRSREGIGVAAELPVPPCTAEARVFEIGLSTGQFDGQTLKGVLVY